MQNGSYGVTDLELRQDTSCRDVWPHPSRDPSLKAEIVQCNRASTVHGIGDGVRAVCFLAGVLAHQGNPHVVVQAGAGLLLATARSPSLTVTELLVVQAVEPQSPGYGIDNADPWLSVTRRAWASIWIGQPFWPSGPQHGRPGQRLTVATFCDWRKRPPFHKARRDPPASSADERRGWSRIVHGLPSKWPPKMTFPGSSVALKAPLTSENAAGSPTPRHAPSTINAT
jgi:hypothetical protein